MDDQVNADGGESVDYRQIKLDKLAQLKREGADPYLQVRYDRTHQTAVTLLDNIKKAKSTITILLCYRNYKTQVSTRKGALGLFILTEHTLD